MRHAIYVSPEPDSELARLADGWLGRSPGAQPAVADLSDLTASPRRYGFHGTIVAPFRLAAGRSDTELGAALRSFCGKEQPLDVALQIARLGPFFALVPDASPPPLNALADRAVATFHPFRAEPTDAEVKRRRPDTLSERQRVMLRRWHYPYVFEEFRFHMTLTGAVPAEQRDRIEAALHAHFADALAEPLTIDALVRAEEPEPGAPFEVAERFAFGSASV